MSRNRDDHEEHEDPRLTAYALGQMDELERAAFEAEIAGDAERQREIEEIRAVGAVLGDALAQQPAVELTAQQRARIAAAASVVRPVGSVRRRLVRGAAAAAVLIAAAAGWQWWKHREDEPRVDRVTRADRDRASAGPDARSSVVRRLLPGESELAGERGARAPGSRILDFDVQVAQGATASAGEPAAAASPVPEAIYLGVGGAQPGVGVIDLNGMGQPTSSADPRASLITPTYTTEAYRFVPPRIRDCPTLDSESLFAALVSEGTTAETYARIVENPFARVTDAPLSTFSIDVDTASYANVRRMLRAGQLPPPDAVRIEELVNYFPYDYEGPGGAVPFSIQVEVAACPWQPQHRLVRIALRGRDLETLRAQPRNLVFLIDVSGSMDSPDKLPLLKRSMRMLVDNLTGGDRVAIVTYAGSSGCVLEPTFCDRKAAILEAIDRLEPGGSTAGAAGIELAYQLAQKHFDKEGINRVILATDGDFNVGVSSDAELTRIIEEKAKGGVFLSVLGFGTGNLQDAKMESLADHGNGNYAYVDSVLEAEKVLVREMGATLVAIAKDVKLQIELNPAQVAAYRLLGYENRALAAQDFNDDKKDAGEIGAGHRVTAFYEVVPAGLPVDAASVDPLKYQSAAPSTASLSGELMTVKLRYKQPDGDKSELLEQVVRDLGATFETASGDFRFAAAVASFGMLLRDSQHKGAASFATVAAMAAQALGDDRFGYRAEFLELVGRAAQIGK